MALYARSEDLIRVGAYQKGSDPELDAAITVLPTLEDFLRQDSVRTAALAANIEALLALGN